MIDEAFKVDQGSTQGDLTPEELKTLLSKSQTENPEEKIIDLLSDQYSFLSLVEKAEDLSNSIDKSISKLEKSGNKTNVESSGAQSVLIPGETFHVQNTRVN